MSLETEGRPRRLHCYFRRRSGCRSAGSDPEKSFSWFKCGPPVMAHSADFALDTSRRTTITFYFTCSLIFPLLCLDLPVPICRIDLSAMSKAINAPGVRQIIEDERLSRGVSGCSRTLLRCLRMR